MSRGWHSRLDGGRPDTPAVAVVLKKDFPEPETVRAVLGAAPPGTIFVVRDRDEAAKDALKGLALPYVSAPLNPFWAWKNRKLVWEPHPSGEMRLKLVEEAAGRRAEARAEELLNTCHRVIVFTTPNSTSEDDFTKGPFVRDNLRIVERGKAPKKRAKKGRKVE